jgi:hypothetical protein
MDSDGRADERVKGRRADGGTKDGSKGSGSRFECGPAL